MVLLLKVRAFGITHIFWPSLQNLDELSASSNLRETLSKLWNDPQYGFHNPLHELPLNSSCTRLHLGTSNKV